MTFWDPTWHALSLNFLADLRSPKYLLHVMRHCRREVEPTPLQAGFTDRLSGRRPEYRLIHFGSKGSSRVWTQERQLPSLFKDPNFRNFHGIIPNKQRQK